MGIVKLIIFISCLFSLGHFSLDLIYHQPILLFLQMVIKLLELLVHSLIVYLNLICLLLDSLQLVIQYLH